MRNILLLVFFFAGLTTAAFVQGQTFYSTIDSGNWNDTENWEDGVTPVDMPNNDVDITINENDSIFKDGDFDANNDIEIHVYGILIIDGDLTVKNRFVVNVHEGGYFNVTGDVQIDAGQGNDNPGELVIDGMAVFNGALCGTGNVSGDGYLVVDGEVCDGIDFSDDITLPIELLSFSASPSGFAVEIQWSTASETNNMGFEIQRLNNNQWEVIGFVDGNYNHNGELNYAFKDFQPLEGVNYYRLKQMDYDGAYEFFGPVAAQLPGKSPEEEIKLMRAHGSVYVLVPGTDAGKMEVYDIRGNRVLSQFGNGQIHVPLPRGFYIVTFTTGKETFSARVAL